MNTISAFFDTIVGVVKDFNYHDFIDILLISFIIYKAIKLVRETRAEQLVKGILLLAFSYFISLLLELKTMTFLFENVFQIGIIALIILFQPELRRILEKVGRTHVSALNVFIPDNTEKKFETWERSITRICDAVQELSMKKTGALIVMERTTKLGEQIVTGVELNANITVELLMNIFFVNTPLHDGAVIVRDGKILAAACFLPKPQKEELIETQLGSRHRAALGISEISDAITIVVSEETGTISISEEGRLTRNFSKEALRNLLMDKLVTSREIEEKAKKKSLKKAARKEKIKK